MQCAKKVVLLSNGARVVNATRQINTRLPLAAGSTSVDEQEDEASEQEEEEEVG